ncbi:DUF3304 domain-containing protein [Pseudomonas turukhanskensis]|uniref:DUF3304 domain-containing protein n=1 Tax=Pseudomonas turukhanskensis TaxID=1806536 RepID=UPI0022F33A49|nr:DUF3304 domain-containing protein [Pseudomonas turukhanskensis]
MRLLDSASWSGAHTSLLKRVQVSLRGSLTLTLALSAHTVSAGNIYGINHTHWAINRFSVDGRASIDGIDPFQRGGGGNGYSVPARWKSGFTVRVDWETGIAFPKGFPGFADDERYDAWAREVRSQSRQLSKNVPVPDYTGQEVCGLTVHFLPCDDIQVTTSCFAYRHPEYPIKTPLQLPEPASCPR